MAEKDTGIPIEIEGITTDRVLKAPVDGIFYSNKEIGDFVKKGEVVGWIDRHALFARIEGVLRGLLHNEIKIKKGTKVGEIDPRGIKEYCFIVTEKAREIGEGTLKAISQLK
jgi:xanthine dehydrogenase accessory factor